MCRRVVLVAGLVFLRNIWLLLTLGGIARRSVTGFLKITETARDLLMSLVMRSSALKMLRSRSLFVSAWLVGQLSPVGFLEPSSALNDVTTGGVNLVLRRAAPSLAAVGV